MKFQDLVQVATSYISNDLSNKFWGCVESLEICENLCT